MVFEDSPCALEAGGTVQWFAGDLDAGASVSCDVDVAVVDRGTVVNTASADSLDLPPGGVVEATATFEAGGGVAEVPALGWPGMLLLAALLAGLGHRRLRVGQ